MKLLTKELKKAIPPLRSTENLPAGRAVVVTKFFTPDANWTWYVVEGSARLTDDTYVALSKMDEVADRVADIEFFGLVDGHEKEVGYFVLSELQMVRGGLGLPIERDLYWKPAPMSELNACSSD